jgi:hypothetical protein
MSPRIRAYNLAEDYHAIGSEYPIADGKKVEPVRATPCRLLDLAQVVTKTTKLSSRQGRQAAARFHQRDQWVMDTKKIV